MIEFHNKTRQRLVFEKKYTDWVISILEIKNKTAGDICFIFCSDDYLLEINRVHLEHDYYTDIITFDYSEKAGLSGDIFIFFRQGKGQFRDVWCKIHGRVKEGYGTWGITFNGLSGWNH